MERDKALKLIEALDDEYGDSGARVYDAYGLAEYAGMHMDTFLPLVEMYTEHGGFVGELGVNGVRAKDAVGVGGLDVLNWIAGRLGLDVQCSALGRCRNARATIDAIHQHFGVLA